MASDIDLLFSSGETKDVNLEFKGKKVVVKIRDISWSEKNKILSDCLAYASDGKAGFDVDKYNKAMLKKMVVSITVGDSAVPPGEINEIFFTRLNSSFGSMLEKFVPKAFEEIGTNDFFGKG